MVESRKEVQNTWRFGNALRLNTKTLKSPLNNKQIQQILRNNIDESDLTKIRSLGNFSSNKIWIIEFASDLNITKYKGKTFKHENIELSFEDANINDNFIDGKKVKDGKITVILRVHFLPHNIRESIVMQFIEQLRIPYLEITKITDEHYSDVGWRHVKNGVKRIKINFPTESEKLVNNLVGPVKFFGLRALITIAGQRPRCFFCHDQNHTIKECQLKDTLCTKCNYKGHPPDKCSLAEKIKSINRTKIDYCDLFMEELPESEPQTESEHHIADDAPQPNTQNINTNNQQGDSINEMSMDLPNLEDEASNLLGSTRAINNTTQNQSLTNQNISFTAETSGISHTALNNSKSKLIIGNSQPFTNVNVQYKPVVINMDSANGSQVLSTSKSIKRTSTSDPITLPPQFPSSSIPRNSQETV